MQIQTLKAQAFTVLLMLAGIAVVALPFLLPEDAGKLGAIETGLAFLLLAKNGISA